MKYIVNISRVCFCFFIGANEKFRTTGITSILFLLDRRVRLRFPSSHVMDNYFHFTDERTEVGGGLSHCFRVLTWIYWGPDVFLQTCMSPEHTFSSLYFLIWDFITNHIGLSPIFPFGSNFLLACVVLCVGHLEVSPKGHLPLGSLEKDGTLPCPLRRCQAQHPAVGGGGDWWMRSHREGIWGHLDLRLPSI